MLDAVEYKALTDRIVDVVGEHSLNYVVICEIPKDDELHTVCLWHGGMNTALGMVERGKMRLMEKTRRHDFPPEDSGGTA
jgi:hypothetical protein